MIATPNGYQALAGAPILVTEQGISNPVWNISGGGAVAGYVQGQQYPALNANIPGSSVTFYGTQNGTATATCTGAIAGSNGSVSVTAAANVQIVKPTAAFAFQDPATSVLSSGMLPGFNPVDSANSAPLRLLQVWATSFSWPTGYQPQTSFACQIITSSVRNSTGTATAIDPFVASFVDIDTSLPFANALDAADPYPNTTTFSLSTPTIEQVMLFQDYTSASLPDWADIVDGYYASLTANDSFITYLMYQPNSGIPITVAWVNWGWNGDAAWPPYSAYGGFNPMGSLVSSSSIPTWITVAKPDLSNGLWQNK